MESSATCRSPEIDATDLLEMRENNQNKNTQRSTKNWVKVFDLWRAERSKMKKLEAGIHIRSRPVVPDDLKPLWTSIITPKVVRWTSEVKINVFSRMSSRAII